MPLPTILEKNFRLDTQDLVLEVLAAAMQSCRNHVVFEGDDELTREAAFGFTITDLNDFIATRDHKVRYIVKKLGEVGLITNTGRYAVTMPGHPAVYALTDLFNETVGDPRQYTRKFSPVAMRSEERVSPKFAGYSEVFVNEYSERSMTVNEVMNAFARQTVIVSKSRSVAGMLGAMALTEEFDVDVLKSGPLVDWLEDYILYLENLANILRQLQGSAYLKGHGARAHRDEIFTPMKKDGGLLQSDEETGLDLSGWLEGLSHFVHDLKARELVGDVAMGTVEMLGGKIQEKLDTGNDV